MNDTDLMRLAIGEASKSQEATGCGVVIAKDGQILAQTYNQQRSAHDATAHAEILAIREAGLKRGQKSLEGCIAYCTCEPCIMCLAALVFARVAKIVYGTSMQETFPDNLPIKLTSEALLATASRRPELIAGFLRDECLKLVR